MTRSSRKKENCGDSSELSEDNCTVGTAARTRPFSCDEIMLKRKHKNQPADVKEVIGGKLSGKDINEKVPDAVKSYRKRNKDSLRDDEKHASEGFLNLNSRKKEVSISVEEGKLLNAKNKESHRSERNSKTSPKRSSFVDRAKRGEIDEREYGKRKSNKYNDSEKESERRRSRDYVMEDKHADRNRGNTEKEGKRKHRNEDDEKSRDRNAIKKHDSYKWREPEPEPKEKREKKESSKVLNEDSRLKRRRSRSRERAKDTGRRSISLSPRAHKLVSHEVRDHRELSSHSSKDKSGRSNQDVDSARMSSNGFSGYHRRHGNSESKLGGYSPRKRRTEAAAKTPSPTIHSPEKKSAGWDRPPSKSESSFNGSVLSNLQSSGQIVAANIPHVSMMVPVNSNTAMTVVGIMSTASSPKVDTSADSIQLTQATRPSRRLYVENLPAETSEESVMKCINNFILSSSGHHVQGSHPCISCIINKEKNHALVEFLTPEDASAALSFDGRTFEGSILKVRRPKDFYDASTGIPRKSVAEVGSISKMVKDSPHKIFIGGISKTVSSDMLMEIACVFGPLRAYHYEVNTYLNEPCAFLEYVDQSMTNKACAGLNGMKLGGQVLTVVQAMQNASLNEKDGNPPSYEIPSHAKPLLEEPTHVLKLKNVIDPQDLSLISESELEEILEDIRLECARFGTVKSVNVVKAQNLIISPETNEVGNDVFAKDGAGLEYDDTKTRTKVQQGSDYHDLEELGSSEPSSSHKFEKLAADADVNRGSDDNINMVELSSMVRKPDVGDEATETNSMSEDKLMDNLEKYQVHQPMQVDDGAKVVEDSANQESSSDISIKISNQLDASVDKSEICDDIKDDSQTEVHQVEIELSFKEEKNRKENVMSDGASSGLDHSLTKELDGAEKDAKKEQESDQGDVFDPGCVLVEFRRTEASCMAAHCLQGRLFDDRIVTVGYVNLDSYRDRFPK